MLIAAYGQNGKTVDNTVTVGKNVTNFTAVGAGENGAFGAKITVKNAIAGTGWTDVDGTKGMANIAVSTEGQKLDQYKMVQFAPLKSTDISGAAVTGITNMTYTGKELTQSGIKVALNGKTLVNGTDYAVKYSDNTNAGTAKVKIAGINAYSGTIDKTFQIAKAAQEVKSVTPKSGAVKKFRS